MIRIGRSCFISERQQDTVAHLLIQLFQIHKYTVNLSDGGPMHVEGKGLSQLTISTTMQLAPRRFYCSLLNNNTRRVLRQRDSSNWR